MGEALGRVPRPAHPVPTPLSLTALPSPSCSRVHEPLPLCPVGRSHSTVSSCGGTLMTEDSDNALPLTRCSRVCDCG